MNGPFYILLNSDRVRIGKMQSVDFSEMKTVAKVMSRSNEDKNSEIIIVATDDNRIQCFFHDGLIFE